MEYQKLKNLLKNNLLTTNQASKFRIKNWIEMSDDYMHKLWCKESSQV